MELVPALVAKDFLTICPDHGIARFRLDDGDIQLCSTICLAVQRYFMPLHTRRYLMLQPDIGFRAPIHQDVQRGGFRYLSIPVT